MQITFNTTEQVAKIYELCCSMIGKNSDEVFEICVKELAEKVLKQANAQSNEHNKNDHPMESFSEISYKVKTKSTSKAKKRLPLWVNRPHQYNHGIVRAFLKNENENGLASRTKMRNTFLNDYPEAASWQFDQNFASMCTDEGNSHGKVFIVRGDIVKIDENVVDIVNSLKDKFLLAE